MPRSGLLFVLKSPAARQLCRGQVAEQGRCIARTNTRQEDIMSRRHNVHLASWGAGNSILAARAGSPSAEIPGRVPLAPRGIADCRWPETKGAATRAAPTTNIDFQLLTVLSTCRRPCRLREVRRGRQLRPIPLPGAVRRAASSPNLAPGHESVARHAVQCPRLFIRRRQRQEPEVRGSDGRPVKPLAPPKSPSGKRP